MRTMESAVGDFRRHLKVKDVSLYDAIYQCQIDPSLKDGYPKELWPTMISGGLAMKQEPLQLVRLLRLMEAEKVKSFIEIGICDGGDFIVIIEYLASFGRDVTAWGIDPYPTQQLYRYVNQCDPGAFWGVKVDIRILPFASETWPFGLEIPHFDFGIVDGMHTPAHCSLDMKNMSQICDWMAVHDVSQLPECFIPWNDFKVRSGRKWSTIDDQQPSVEVTGKPICGFGILWPKGRK